MLSAMTTKSGTQIHYSDCGPTVRQAMLAAIPELRAFAVSLCRNVDQADDLVQETLLRGCAHISSFLPGSNMSAWLFTILRNLFYSECRKRRRTFEPVDEHVETLMEQPTQFARIEYAELCTALAKLPAEEREVLILIEASGFSYAEAAKICGCAEGTVKSRVRRARARLAQLLSSENVRRFRRGADWTRRNLIGGLAGEVALVSRIYPATPN
jgi:RNA polymerase sigma-70 factor (ECF subfamily)